MTKSVDAKDKTLREILSNVQYSIDFYQRDYKWQTKQCEELVSDLTGRFLDSFQTSHVRSDVASYPAYFLGSIVLSKKPDGVYVVDGQQRLTTLTLLLMYLRNEQITTAVQEDPNVQPLIQSTQFGKQNFNMNVDGRKQIIESLYSGQIPTEEPDDLSSLNILNRYQDIEAYFPEQCKGDVLPFFMDWLIERVQLVEISAYSDEDAYTVFETMNDRGLSLSPADMLKGYLLSNIRDPNERTNAEKVWAASIPQLQSLLMKDAENDFFRTWFRGRYASTYGGSGGDYERLGPEFHRWLRDKSESLGLKRSSDFQEFCTKDIPTYAKQYKLLRTRQRQFDSNYELHYFVGEHKLDEGLLILGVVSVDDSASTAEAKMRVVARFLDIWVYRRLWASKNLTKPALKSTFISWARELRTLDLEALTARLYAELTKRGHDNFGTAPPLLTGSSRRKIHRLLARLTSFVEVGSDSTKKDPYPDLVVHAGRSRFDIEHIWPKKFKDYDHLFKDEAEFEDYRNRIGSLLLIPHTFNSSYNDMKTDDKLRLYGRSDHHLLVASLATSTYEKNPTFRDWRDETGFKFQPYDEKPDGFTRQSSEARLELYRDLARSIWSPDHLIIDSGLDSQAVRELADRARENLTSETEADRVARTHMDVQIIDLIQSGLVKSGDILIGRRPGASSSATAILLENGSIELEKGERFTAPSGAAMSLGLNVTLNGWDFWIHQASGKQLKRLREEYLQRLGRFEDKSSQDALFNS